MPIRFAFLALLLFATGCDSGEDTPSLRAPGGRTPTAGAIEYRDENNVYLGIIGPGTVRRGLIITGDPPEPTAPEPGGNGETPTPRGSFEFGPAYPNPFWRGVTFTFGLPSATRVSVFVVAALPPGQTEPPVASEQGAWVYRPAGLPVAVLWDGPRTAGSHQVYWDPAETPGRAFPFGYYRVYVQTPYALAWQDVLYTPDSPYDN